MAALRYEISQSSRVEKCLKSESSEQVKGHSTKNFVSPRGHVIVHTSQVLHKILPYIFKMLLGKVH